tara:strand:- start:2242 stop:2403 length:162 start_codon:yes stop_codon:yes gene_type:complete
MKNIITAPEQVKPNFKKVKERWKILLSRYHNSDAQSSLDSFMMGDLLRGFWFK